MRRYRSVPVLRVVREKPFRLSELVTRRPADAVKVFCEWIGDEDREHFVIMLFDTRHRAIGVHTVSIGSLSASIVHPREVFKVAIAANAASMILAHNHPSGDTSPSQDDLEITRRLRRCGDLIGIEVLDHLIVVGNRLHQSLRELGHF